MYFVSNIVFYIKPCIFYQKMYFGSKSVFCVIIVCILYQNTLLTLVDTETVFLSSIVTIESWLSTKQIEDEEGGSFKLSTSSWSSCI